MVCRKTKEDVRSAVSSAEAYEKAACLAYDKLTRLKSSGLNLSRNDCRVVVFSQFICSLGPVDVLTESARASLCQGGELDELSDCIYANISHGEWQTPIVSPQLSLILADKFRGGVYG